MNDPAGPRRKFEIVAMAASAGGLSALGSVLAGLPGNFPAAVVLVQHLAPHHESLLAEILGKRTKLRVTQARAGDRLAPGTVHVAPPDEHLLVSGDGSLSLSHSELVHFVRPSADLLFESVAAGFKDRAIAVVLTGTGSDASIGIVAVKKMGGVVVVQDEATSEFFGMPDAAIRTRQVDMVLPLEAIAPALVRMVMGETNDA